MNENKKKYNLPVGGMTCASCVAKVEKVLNKIEGIENAQVNFATEKVSFDVKDKNVDLKAAAEKLEKFGYSLNLNSSQPNEKSNKENISSEQGIQENNDLTKDFRLALILTIPVFLISMLSNMYSGWPISTDYTHKILLILTTPILFIPGERFFKIFWTNLNIFHLK
jgi:cation transport ATPase